MSAKGVRVIVRDDRPRVPMRLTPAQTTALLGKMPADHADLAYLLAATGVRISEALGTTWADVGHDADGTPTLRITKSKTRAGERTIPLSPETARMLTRRRTSAEFGAATDPIFPNATGVPMDDHNYRRRVFKPAAKRAGVPWATPHKLRHGMRRSWPNTATAPPISRRPWATRTAACWRSRPTFTRRSAPWTS